MRKSIFAMFICFNTYTGTAQLDSAALVPRIFSAADSMTTAFRNKDFNTFAHFNNKRLIDVVGGEAEFASFIEKQMEQLKDVNFTVMKPGRIIRVLAYEDSYQCIIEQQSELQMEGVVFSSVSHLVGLSFNKGQSWRFADGNTGNMEDIKSVLPELSPLLLIPKKKQEMGKTLPELLKDYKTEY
jgi:hypothetical protein